MQPSDRPHLSPHFHTERTRIFAGDCLDIMPGLESESMDAVVTDPPYSSGGMYRGDRMATTQAKYVQGGRGKLHPNFEGDSRDQRGYLVWSRMWMSEAYRVTKRGGALLCFTDWRQLPITTDAIQAAGWVWRGIVPWDKTEGSRPQRGWFRSQCEYVLCASKGSLGREQERASEVYAAGCFRHPSDGAKKYHIAGKPLPLMRDLLQIFPAGATILDPFAGSGSTLIAAHEGGLQSIGIEIASTYLEVLRARLAGLAPAAEAA